MAAVPVHAGDIDPVRIREASGAEAKKQPDGVVRIGWSRTDVPVEVDGMRLPPTAGLGSWAAFAPMGDAAMVMGDTVVFEDEVDAAMDAAFKAGLDVTGLHNHFFFDQPKACFMHIGGHGEPTRLAAGVKAVWDAIKAVRKSQPEPATGFGGPVPVAGSVDADAIGKIVGHAAEVNAGIAKITIGREARMHGERVGASMGLTTWVAFSGSDQLATADGDVIMSAGEVQLVLRALRQAKFHVVALHNHMIGEQPAFYFVHFWGKGPALELAHGFRRVLDAQQAAALARS
ncbi:LppY/LpqO family protein [Lysobacter sp. Root494]|uniref:LppY/LpqO family protein n=1 Tax=Lysobacter sp. Root494 TaxID=1736549 RepID=UPI0006FA4A19|nr:LppY/LpqO family protein [Lysobacter sp. Root494]KQY52622.1 hypothetical protein ASD14_08540 [Lysobacter sp. Root494]